MTRALRIHALVLALVAGLTVSGHTGLQAQGGCAATPEEAWRLAREAVATGDAGLVTERLSPAYRTRNSSELTAGTTMMAEMGGLSSGMSTSSGAAAAARTAEGQLLKELDGLLRKYKAPSIKEIGTPLLEKIGEPVVLAKFAPIDHVGFAREVNQLFARAEKAARAAGVRGGAASLDELVVGGGDLKAPLGGLAIDGDTARASAGRVVMLFRKTGGCWLIDGRE